MSIDEEIRSGVIDAITIDTSIFKAKNHQLETGTLKHLQQLRGSQFSFIMPDIIRDEILNHIKNICHDAEVKARAGIRALRISWLCPDETTKTAIDTLFNSRTAEEIATTRLSNFIETTGCQILTSAKYASIQTVIDLYARTLPPFAQKPDKKHEFPDAIALTCLEGWARRTGSKILTVTNDQGWIEYCNQSKHLVAVNDLGRALSLIHADASVQCSAISIAFEETENELRNRLSEAVKCAAENVEFELNAYSHTDIEADVWDYELKEYSFLRTGRDGGFFQILDFSTGKLTLTGAVDLIFRVNVTCRFFVWDSYDKEEIPMGTSEYDSELNTTWDFIITLEGDIPRNPKIADIEVASETLFADLAYVEPDY